MSVKVYLFIRFQVIVVFNAGNCSFLLCEDVLHFRLAQADHHSFMTDLIKSKTEGFLLLQ